MKYIDDFNEDLKNLSNKDKQLLGQLIVSGLGGKPGPKGKDGGIDGTFYDDDKNLYTYQIKLKREALITREELNDFFMVSKSISARAGIFISITGLSSDAKNFYENNFKNEFHIVDATIRDIISNNFSNKLISAGIKKSSIQDMLVKGLQEILK